MAEKQPHLQDEDENVETADEGILAQINPLSCQRFINSLDNCWRKNTTVKVSKDRFIANCMEKRGKVMAAKGFDISLDIRTDDFLGTLIYYYELTKLSSDPGPLEFIFGLTDRSNHSVPQMSTNSFFWNPMENKFTIGNHEWQFQWPTKAIKPNWNDRSDVFGCGLMLKPGNKRDIFFTSNGILIGKFSIDSATATLVYATAYLKNITVGINFGDNASEPFCFDIKCHIFEAN